MIGTLAIHSGILLHCFGTPKISRGRKSYRGASVDCLVETPEFALSTLGKAEDGILNKLACISYDTVPRLD